MLVQAMKNSKGFTLVELIVVITILAILATIGFLSLQGYTSDAKNTKTQANLRTVSSSLVNEQAITQQGFDTYIVNAFTGYAAGANDVTFSGANASFKSANIYNTQIFFGSGAYMAGKIKPEALRIDGSKFFEKDVAGNLEPYAVGAASINETTNSKTRQRTVFQVAGTLNNAGVQTALVEGTYGTGSATDLAGLIKDYSATTGTGTDAVVAGGSKIPYSLK